MSCTTSKNLKIELYLIEIDNTVSSEWRKHRGTKVCLARKVSEIDDVYQILWHSNKVRVKVGPANTCWMFDTWLHSVPLSL